MGYAVEEIGMVKPVEVFLDCEDFRGKIAQNDEILIREAEIFVVMSKAIWPRDWSVQSV